jgi:hypothetical protein
MFEIEENVFNGEKSFFGKHLFSLTRPSKISLQSFEKRQIFWGQNSFYAQNRFQYKK